ncbi:MAG: hypothetical protein GY941_10275, partial [Planctomycetes bacterium]|nr:hypothetical protein [Planctomycetota bacterium]
MLTIYLGQFISNDIVVLFNWNFITKSLLMAFGVYIVFRTLTMHLLVRLSLIPILLFSSFMVVSFRQCGLFDQFVMIPFVTYFLLRIVYFKDYGWFNWFALAGTIGINWQSYFFTGTWIFLLFFFLGVMFFRRDLLTNLFKAEMIVAKFAVLILVIFAMAAPSFVLLMEKDRYAFPARMLDSSYEGKAPQGGPQQHEGENLGMVSSSSGINMPYSFIAFTGTFSTIWDFMQLISPAANRHILWPNRNKWGNPSEAYMYLGVLPWAIAILGMVSGRHGLKKVWFLVFVGFGLLMLGPPGGLHRLMYYTYPPMWFVRHTHSFVLIFIFAFLYFYILGLNHILSAWAGAGALFRPETSQGILDRHVRDKRHCMWFAIVLFITCITLIISLAAHLEYPASNYLFVFIVMIVVAGWFLRKDLGKKGLYMSLISSSILIVLVFTNNYFTFVRALIEMLIFPIVLYVFIRTRKNLSESAKYFTSYILVVTFASCLSIDLIYHFDKTSSLYLDTPHPGLIHNVKTTPQEPLLPRERSICPEYSNSIYTVQSTRYLSLVYRQPFVFSPVMEMDRRFFNRDIFDDYKKLSFDKWSLLPGGNASPDKFDHIQDGNDGSVERYIYDDGVRDRKVLALLKPSSSGNSTLKYKTDKIDELRGRYIRVSVMAKSDNTTPDAIQAAVQDGAGTSVSKSYENGGNWERLDLVKHVDESAEYLQLTCSIMSTATADVFFDYIKIDVLPHNDFFDDANAGSHETVFDEYKKFLLYNYTASDEVLYDEVKKFSFEKWFILPDNSLCPEHFVYQQGRYGGSVERFVTEDAVEGKRVCAFIRPSSRGNSLIRHQTDQIDELRGRYIKVSAMVKSENVTPDAIQVDVQKNIVTGKIKDGEIVKEKIEAPTIESYGNSGTWERIELIKYISENSESLRITLNVTSTATAGAYFDWLKVDVMTNMGSVPYDKSGNELEFERTLKSKRLSSFLLPIKYFELIHADIPYSAKVEMFAVDKPVFQFKKGYVRIEEKELPTFLSQLGPEKSVNLLEDAVIMVDGTLPPNVSKLRIPKEEYGIGSQAFSRANLNNAGGSPGVKGEGEFKYSIERYDYDS